MNETKLISFSSRSINFDLNFGLFETVTQIFSIPFFLQVEVIFSILASPKFLIPISSIRADELSSK